MTPNRPYYKQQILEGSDCDVGWNSRASNLDPVPLSGVRYRIDDMTNGLEIQAWTEVDFGGNDPAAKGTVTIPASLNVRQRKYNRTELRQVRFELSDENGGKQTQTAYYELVGVWEP